jgi:hypothetical protein
MNDSAYTLHIDPPKKRKVGQHKEGYHAWNRGLSWEEQGWTEERKKKVVAQLRENIKKNTKYGITDHFKKPVIQMDEYGNRLHWYESSEAAARKLCVSGRNIRKVCDGERNFCGGYRWCWDERFLT